MSHEGQRPKALPPLDKIPLPKDLKALVCAYGIKRSQGDLTSKWTSKKSISVI